MALKESKMAGEEKLGRTSIGLLVLACIVTCGLCAASRGLRRMIPDDHTCTVRRSSDD